MKDLLVSSMRFRVVGNAPASPKRGEGVRGREEDSASSRKDNKGLRMKDWSIGQNAV